MSSIVVTGAGGYIGSVLCARLIENDYQVVAVDVNLKALVPLCRFRSFKPVLCDISDEAVMADLLSSCDAVVHLAAVVGSKSVDADYIAARKTAIDGTQRLLDWSDGKLFIYPNTDAGYPNAPGKLTEDTPMSGLTHYAELKIAGEQLVLAAGGISLRLGSVFGAAPAMRHGTLLNWMVGTAVRQDRLALSQAGARRTLLHVEDAVEAIIHALSWGYPMKGKAFNVSLPAMIKLDMCEHIKKYWPAFSWHVDQDAYSDPDWRDFDMDCTRLRDVCHWQPMHDIDLGICELIRVYKALGASL